MRPPPDVLARSSPSCAYPFLCLVHMQSQTLRDTPFVDIIVSQTGRHRYRCYLLPVPAEEARDAHERYHSIDVGRMPESYQETHDLARFPLDQFRSGNIPSQPVAAEARPVPGYAFVLHPRVVKVLRKAAEEGLLTKP